MNADNAERELNACLRRFAAAIPGLFLQKLKEEYFKEAHESENYIIPSSLTAYEIAQLIKTDLSDLNKEISSIADAFIPSSVTTFFGIYTPASLERRCRHIAELAERIRVHIGCLKNQENIKERAAYALSVREQDIAKADSEHAARSLALQLQLKKKLVELRASFDSDLRAFRDRGLFSDSGAIPLGTLSLPGDILQQGSDEIRLSISCSDIDQSMGMITDAVSKSEALFADMALGILMEKPDSKIYLGDVESLGSTFSPLLKLEKRGRLNIIKSEEELLKTIACLKDTIASNYDAIISTGCKDLEEYNDKERLRLPESYLLINDIHLLPEGIIRELSKIMTAGKKAGVYVVFSMERDAELSRSIQRRLEEIANRHICLDVKADCCDISGLVSLELPNHIDESSLKKAESTEIQDRFASVLGLADHLPDRKCIHKKDSSSGIELELGLDGRGSVITLELNEMRPYMMILGDVDTGKSSLLHSMILQVLFNYDDHEVKLAIADFKNGAEFDRYAELKLRGIETVVDDEDADVKTSFLKYYTKIIEARQREFEALEEKTGVIIRKYETYREISAKSGTSDAEVMPRIVIIIDEFQSLFEDTPDTAMLMSRLVRNGRTYGIHIVMASQRASGDSLRNSFTAELKNYFTYRLIFRCPQQAASLAFSQNAADSGRINSAIAAAPLLQKGEAILNTYMGQAERDNCRLRCFYPDDSTIMDSLKLLTECYGGGDSILLKKNRRSGSASKDLRQNWLDIGTSACLHVDVGEDEEDFIKDDGEVSVHLKDCGGFIAFGNDMSFRRALLYSVSRYAESFGLKLHIFRNHGIPGYMDHDSEFIKYHTGVKEQLEELRRQLDDQDDHAVNMFLNMTDESIYSQSIGAIRATAESELLKSIISVRSSISVFVERSFKTMSRSMPYAVNALPVRIISVGDIDNIRGAMPDNFLYIRSEFDSPSRNSIKAYYHNAVSGKHGKLILYKG